MLNFDKSQCKNPSCFFCIMKEPNPFHRRSKLTGIFQKIPQIDSKDHVLVLSTLWNIAICEPDDPEFPSLGLFKCMSKLITKSLKNKSWLLKDQNIFIPYYATHIIGSYVMNKEELASLAICGNKDSSNLDLFLGLMDLFKGKISWVEQRVAARALAHLSTHDKTFKVISFFEDEIVKLSMEISSNCVENVYKSFINVNDDERLKYHSDLLTRGLGGIEKENQRCEKWVLELHSWCLHILNSFASRERSINRICEKGFLKKMIQTWGGLANRNSPGWIGLIKTLCKTEIGREKVCEVKEVIEKLCDISRSSDDWKEMALDTLLMIVKDSKVRYRVFDVLVCSLVDLGEDNVYGDKITQMVLQDYHKIKYNGMKMRSEEGQRSIESLWEVKVEKKKRERLMDEIELEERRKMVKLMKKRGKERFLKGLIEESMELYTKGIEFCLLDMVKDRVVLYSNRSQCYLLLKKAEFAISDATKALSLSGVVHPHGKSLWRRSQAFDLKGNCGRESLMDCLAFVDYRLKSSDPPRIPYYAVQMISKQMKATWVFATADKEIGRS